MGHIVDIKQPRMSLQQRQILHGSVHNIGTCGHMYMPDSCTGEGGASCTCMYVYTYVTLQTWGIFL